MKSAKRCVGTLLAAVFLIGIGSSGLVQTETQSPWASPGDTANAIDFGGVPIGQTATATYTFRVLETSETSATVTIAPPSTPFGTDAPTYPFTLVPGQAITFRITFTPSAATSYTGALTITAEGGYPPQTTTTIVSLTGHGVASSEYPDTSGAPTTTTSELGIPSVSVPFVGLGDAGTETSAEAVPGTTDDEGGFSVLLPPATTVAGRLTECGDGPLASQPFTLTPLSEAFRTAVPGYEEVTSTQFSKLSMMGTEYYDLGEICLVPGGEGIPTGTVAPSAEEAGADSVPPAFIGTYTAPAANISTPSGGEFDEALLDIDVGVAYLEVKLDALSEKLAGMATKDGVAKLEAKLDALGARVGELTDKVDELGKKLDTRLPRSRLEEIGNLQKAQSCLAEANVTLKNLIAKYKRGDCASEFRMGGSCREIVEELSSVIEGTVGTEYLGSIANRDYGVWRALLELRGSLNHLLSSDAPTLQDLEGALESKEKLESKVGDVLERLMEEHDEWIQEGESSY